MGPVLIAAAGLLNLSACGSVAAPPGPASGSTVLLGQADAGRTIQVKAGDTVRITLEDDYPVPGSSVVWNVTSSNEAVLALGATKWEMVRMAVLRNARAGILGAVILLAIVRLVSPSRPRHP